MFITALKKLLLPSTLLIIIILFTNQPLWVEQYYTYGLYNNFIAPTLRLLFGWLPFSLGDVLYLLAILYLLKKVVQFFTKKKWQTLKQYWLQYITKATHFLLWFYILFLLLWGINYSRPGIAYQLNITPQKYSTQNIVTLINYHDSVLKTLDTLQLNNTAAYTFKACKALIAPSYNNLHTKYNFINNSNISFKKSMFGKAGNYLGFFGYLNPFTNEAQLNNHTPYFLKPFTTLHEVAHQNGYGSESEANLIGYMASMQSNSEPCKMAACFEVLLYAYAELGVRDTLLQKEYIKKASPIFITNYKTLRQYHLKYKSIIDTFTLWLYDAFLKTNKQASGTTSYSELISWLIAHKNKYNTYP